MKQGTLCSYHCGSRQSSGYLFIALSPCIKPLNQCLSKFVNNSGNYCRIRWDISAVLWFSTSVSDITLIDIFHKIIMFLLSFKHRYHCKYFSNSLVCLAHGVVDKCRKCKCIIFRLGNLWKSAGYNL